MWPSDVIDVGQHCFRQRSVTCCTPNLYLNHCWLIVTSALRNKIRWNLEEIHSNFFTEGNAFENGVCKIMTILFRPQCALVRRHWRQASTSPVNIRAIILTTFPFWPYLICLKEGQRSPCLLNLGKLCGSLHREPHSVGTASKDDDTKKMTQYPLKLQQPPGNRDVMDWTKSPPFRKVMMQRLWPWNRWNFSKQTKITP